MPIRIRPKFGVNDSNGIRGKTKTQIIAIMVLQLQYWLCIIDELSALSSTSAHNQSPEHTKRGNRKRIKIIFMFNICEWFVANNSEIVTNFSNRYLIFNLCLIVTNSGQHVSKRSERQYVIPRHRSQKLLFQII